MIGTSNLIATLSEPLESQVLKEPKHSLPPHHNEGRPVQLLYTVVDQLDGVPKCTKRIR